MELTLNLLWVCVAIVGIFAQMVMLSRAAVSSDRRAGARQIVSMGCALVILFFVISMTDDLHGQEVLVEERKVLRMTAVTDVHGPASPVHAIPVDFLLFFPPQVFSLTLPAVRRLLEPSELPFAATIEIDNLRGRAPPVSLLNHSISF